MTKFTTHSRKKILDDEAEPAEPEPEPERREPEPEGLNMGKGMNEPYP